MRTQLAHSKWLKSQQRKATKAQAPQPAIYLWWSELLKQYAQGRLIALATSADEARDKIRGQFDAYVKERYGWLHPDHDADDGEEVDRLKDLLEADLAKEPKVVETGVIYVPGSE